MELKLIDLSSNSEAQKIFDVIQEYYPKSPWPATLEKIMAGGVVYFWAYNGSDRIGMTGYCIKTPTLVETMKTTVFFDHRGKGFGNALSQAIENECRRIGIKKVMTTIYYYNHVMVHIKMKQGYTIEGYHPDHEAPDFHEYSLGKILK